MAPQNPNNLESPIPHHDSPPASQHAARARFLDCHVPSFDHATAAPALDTLIERETYVLTERVRELEGYIDAHNAKVLSDDNPVAKRIAALEAALKANDAALRNHPDGDNRSDEDIALTKSLLGGAR